MDVILNSGTGSTVGFLEVIGLSMHRKGSAVEMWQKSKQP